MIVHKSHKIKDLEFDKQAKEQTIIKHKEKNNSLTATIKTLEGDRSNIKNLNDSLYKELKEIDKKYKNKLDNSTFIKVVYKDKLISTTVTVDRKDSCNPVYNDTITKNLARYIISASKDSITIEDSLTIPLSITQYYKREKIFGRRELYTDVNLVNPSTDVTEVQTFKKKEKNNRLITILVGVSSFVLGVCLK